ncbi:hypothetical protein [Dermacoccus profundi]|uniref:hypothetical protein n=1 Tax=Dermacoccus profundi TaxID=322602 RepID=UPI0031F90525
MVDLEACSLTLNVAHNLRGEVFHLAPIQSAGTANTRRYDIRKNALDAVNVALLGLEDRCPPGDPLLLLGARLMFRLARFERGLLEQIE